MTLLVTVGSTLFPGLTDTVLSPSTLTLLPSLGISTLVVQLGRADVPAPVRARVPAVPGEFRWDGAAGEERAAGALRVRVLRYTDDLEGEIEAATAVVAHAGAGTILSVLRRGRRLLVVPNTSLMDDHQRELADALGAEGYLDVCMVADLHAGLRRLAEDTPRQPFPAQAPTFKSILDEVAGFV
ncbi:Glycosyltransferase 28 C-terminal domain [Cryptotrichosporon argae]